MPIKYSTISKAVALRANQLADALDASTLENAYRDGSLVDIMDGVDIPFSHVREVVLQTEAQIAVMIGNSNNLLLRLALADRVKVASGKPIPAVSSGTKRFVGKIDGVFDVDTDEPMPEMPAHIIELKRRSKFFKGAARGYSFQGTQLVYVNKADDAYIRGCTFDAIAAAAAFDANSNSVLPYECSLLWINKALANLEQESFFEGKTGNFTAAASACAEELGLVPDPAGVQGVIVTNQEDRNVSNQGNE